MLTGILTLIYLFEIWQYGIDRLGIADIYGKMSLNG
jgi:hypothetical protein